MGAVDGVFSCLGTLSSFYRSGCTELSLVIKDLILKRKLKKKKEKKIKSGSSNDKRSSDFVGVKPIIYSMVWLLQP